MRQGIFVGGLVLALVLGSGGLTAAERGDAAGTDAVEAVAATLDVERTMLAEDLRRHRTMAAERARITERLRELYALLDSAVNRKDAGAASAVEEQQLQVEQAERDRSDLAVREQLLVDRLRDRLRRIALLEDRLEELEARAEAETGPLQGSWSVVLLPTNQRGTFHFNQSGALVTGTYELEGGWTGSLQGTLVSRKVNLVRIDSKLGRSMEFEGYISANGSRIRGTWQSYDVSGGGAPNGHWTAARRSAGP